MKVSKVSGEVGCNFCKRDVLYVYEFTRDSNVSLCAAICTFCIDELVNKVEDLESGSTDD